MTAMNSIADVAAPEAALAIPRFEGVSASMQELPGQLAEGVVNEITGAEADQLCGAMGNSRNGYRERRLVTRVGTPALRIPKLRTGSFFPDDVIERYQRVDRAIVAAVSETCATGTSTRKVQKVAAAMGIERLSKVFLSTYSSPDGRSPLSWWGIPHPHGRVSKPAVTYQLVDEVVVRGPVDEGLEPCHMNFPHSC